MLDTDETSNFFSRKLQIRAFKNILPPARSTPCSAAASTKVADSGAKGQQDAGQVASKRGFTVDNTPIADDITVSGIFLNQKLKKSSKIYKHLPGRHPPTTEHLNAWEQHTA